MSYTENLNLKINALCFSVTLYLSVGNTFETTSFFTFGLIPPLAEQRLQNCKDLLYS